MKRHDLLFRYLDGEITREEDKTLREIMKNDPELGDDFQSFLEIDYHINKINDETEYPEDFIDEVGMKISNRIVLDKELNIMRRQLRRQYATRFVLVPALIAAFFFTFLISIQNPEVNLISFSTGNLESNQISNNSTEINPANTSSLDKVNTKQIKQVTNSEKLITQTSSVENKKIESEINNDNITSELMTNINTHSDTFNQSNAIVTTEQSSTEDQPILPNNIISKPVIQNNFNYQLNEPSMNYYPMEEFVINPKTQTFNQNLYQTALINKSNIEINSLLGTDLVQIGVSSTNQFVSSFTQSFAAELAEGNSLGLETGYLEFKANTKKFTEISTKPSKGGLNGFSVLNQDNNSSDNPVLVRVEGIESTIRKMFWVGLFFERNFLDFDDINISSRITLGASDHGVISSLKLIAKYNLTRGIVLTLGTDAKIFEGSFNENQINRINSAFALIYGVKFTF